MKKKCKICNSGTTEIFQKDSGIKYYFCSQCEFIFKDEASSISRQEELERYNLHNNSYDDGSYVEYFKKFINNAVLDYSNSKKGLDFGSGPYPVLAIILEKEYGFKMDIYDLFYSPYRIYEGKKYNLITATEVVEHLQKPLDYFYLFKQCLDSDSLLAVMTLFHPGDKQQFLDWYYTRDDCHRSFYNLNTMKNIAKRVGLKVIYTDNYRYISFKPV
ncbi:MAG: class I SAM-dependent methyltransferase [Actinomycetia bacterium]|nr:class I SAM-dependent methyltransferase [Actinomycetes bacterium]